MTYREADTERRADLAAVQAASELDEAAALRAMRNRSGLVVARVASGIAIVAASTVGGGALGALLGSLGSSLLDGLVGALLGSGVGLMLGVVAAAVVLGRARGTSQERGE